MRLIDIDKGIQQLFTLPQEVVVDASETSEGIMA
jgi:hypothetical protein